MFLKIPDSGSKIMNSNHNLSMTAIKGEFWINFVTAGPSLARRGLYPPPPSLQSRVSEMRTKRETNNTSGFEKLTINLNCVTKAEVFYYVNYGSSIITSNVCQKIVDF